MAKMVVFGAGMVGSVMAFDLRREGHDVLLVDRSEAALRVAAERFGVQTRAQDLADPAAIQALAADVDVALGALPSSLGLSAMAAVIAAGRPYVDISFLPEDPRGMDATAREAGVTVIYDAGVAPGMSNLLCGRAVAGLDRCDRLRVLVGGLPVARSQPWEYKAPFSPNDVLEEYTRPARYVVGGRIHTGEALSQVEPVDFSGIGTLEAFLTDGLRSLVDLPVPDMVEKTLRYPGHVALLRTLRAMGLFSTRPVQVGGAAVAPRDLFASLVFPTWAFDEEEPDLCVMRVEAEGERGGSPVTWRWDLDDRYDAETGIRSMSRTTAFPATILAGLIADGRISRPGVCAPEALGADAELVAAILDAHAERGVFYTFAEEARA